MRSCTFGENISSRQSSQAENSSKSFLEESSRLIEDRVKNNNVWNSKRRHQTLRLTKNNCGYVTRLRTKGTRFKPLHNHPNDQIHTRSVQEVKKKIERSPPYWFCGVSGMKASQKIIFARKEGNPRQKSFKLYHKTSSEVPESVPKVETSMEFGRALIYYWTNTLYPCELQKRKVYGPFGSEEPTVTGYAYLDVLELRLFPQLNESKQNNIIWHQCGAPLHWHLSVRDWLKITVLDQWIFLKGPHDKACFAWPLRSPDLKQCGFYLWGFIKVSVYVPPLPTDLPDLKHRVEAAVARITSDTLNKVWNELAYRLDV
ncbi:uncharacterized protein TNCV_5059361 [Trichonephila clavipes]|nr:uncharacterized protein TNCV_5059361 [Trichonephila clavipes]